MQVIPNISQTNRRSFEMPQFRLHLLSIFLAANIAFASNINISLTTNNDDDDSVTTTAASFDFTRNDEMSSTIENQSNHSRLINLPVAKVSTTKWTVSDSVQTNASSNKLYNKANSRKRKMENNFDVIDAGVIDWKCPDVSKNSRYLECGCDMPHTLRCSGDIHGLEQLARGLRASKYSVSLLDCTLRNVTFLSDTRIFENVSLNGLVISSGEIKRVHRLAFLGMKTSLKTLGLPNNALTEVPWNALTPLTSLDRLDLSNNRIKSLGPSDFLKFSNLTYLELSDNQISSISPKSFLQLRKLITLKLNGNRLGDSSSSLQAIAYCTSLKELDLASNSIRGPITRNTIPALRFLELLNLDRNLLSSIHTGALQNFPFLITLSLRHNQIDVLQDHAFAGLSSLQMLDLSYNGIIAVSEASLQHLSRLTVLNLTHNFLRALTSDLISPLPALRDLQLDGNDISMVEKNALNTAELLHSLSLRDNPLACDCSMKPFAEWILNSKFPTQNLVGAICATPPHLEGAPLLQIKPETLSCDGNLNRYDDKNVLRQLTILAKQSNVSYEKEFSDVISLKDIHLSPDYGVILTWAVNMSENQFTCDAVFVYHETEIDEMLMRNSPLKIHCERSKMKDENIVNVILHDSEHFTIGENYRFCLVLLQKFGESKRDLIVGCSNVTKLKSIDSVIDGESNTLSQEISTETWSQTESDITHFDQISDLLNEDETITESRDNRGMDESDHSSEENDYAMDAEANTLTTNANANVQVHRTNVVSKNINEIAVATICFGVFVVLVIALIWMFMVFRNNRRPHSTTICYAANDRMDDVENTNRYLKLQATTTL